MSSLRDQKAEETRERILSVTADEIVRVGYQSTALNDIIKKVGLSKGAIYHHFSNKLELGYAVIDELFAKQEAEAWDGALSQENPVEGLIEFLTCMTDNLKGESLECGCPFNNLAHEMSPLDEGFRQRVEAVFNRRRKRIAQAIQESQDKGQFSANVDAEDTASFVLATMQGAMGLAKNAQCNEAYEKAIRGLITYIRSLQLA